MVRLSPAPVAEREPAGVATGGGGEEGRTRKRGLLRRILRTDGGHIPFSKRAKQTLEQSLRETVSTGDATITGGHVLLGVLRVPETTASRVLADTGIDSAALRATTERLLGRSGG
ncbi:Clp protease N-terminal domain-containing protein [Streptomonospora litoralis]